MDKDLKKILEIDKRINENKMVILDLNDEIKKMEEDRKALVKKATSAMIEAGCTASDVLGYRFTVRNTPQAVLIYDESIIPPKFFREKITKSVNKTLIKTAIKDGGTVPGAGLSNGGVTLAITGIIA